MGPMCEEGESSNVRETVATQSSTEELYWVVSKSLTSVSSSCNESVAEINLIQYLNAGNDEGTIDNADEYSFDRLQSSLERSVEDIELAIAAIEELQNRTENQS